jgi:hypothetical protein
MNTNNTQNIDLHSEAKQVVLEEMDKMGLLSKMKAQIKSNVLKILEKQKQSVKQNVEFDYMTPLHKLNKSKEILLACHLIKEFLAFYEMEYTIPIFENESNVRESVKKETISSELSLQNLISSSSEPKPLLVQLITAYQNDLQNKKHSMENIAKGLDDSYGVKGHIYSNTDANFTSVLKSDLNSSSSSHLSTGKKQLTPISFVNKSVEMGDSTSSKSESLKFNTANISDIYSGQGQAENAEKSNTHQNTQNKTLPILTTPINIAKLNSEENKNKISQNQTENSKYQFQSADYNSNNKYDDEFNEVILEEINDKKGPDDEICDILEIEDSKKSITASANIILSSFGYDSSIKDYKLDEFDHVEDVEKP